jgi:hypothetical protein
MNKKMLCIFVSIISLIFSCTPKLKYLTKTQNFTYNQIAGKQFSFMPIVSVQDMESGEISQMEPSIISQFQETYENASFRNSNETSEILEQEILKNVLEQYKINRFVKKEDIINIGQKLNSPYVIFSRINNYYTTQRRRDYTEQNQEKVETKTVATLAGSMTVYNVTTGEVEWDGIHEIQKENKNDFVKEKDSMVVGIIKAATKTEQQFNYPPAPRPSEIYPNLLYAFYKNWPKKD